MISLKRTADRIEDRDRRLAAVLECYLAALDAIETNAVPVHGDLHNQHRAVVRNLRRAVQADHHPDALNECRRSLARELADYCEKCTAILERKDGEIKAIIRTLAEAASTLAGQSEVRSGRLADFTKRLEALAEEADLSTIRRNLAREVDGLKSFTLTARQEEQIELERLRQDLKAFERRLEEAETLAGKDRLTGIANRAEGERQLEAAVGSGRKFSILLLDLDGFKTVNDRYGHQAGDLVLQAFARRISRCVRPQDTVCRWGGDEFLVVLPGCGLKEAMARAKEISVKCGAGYDIRLDGRPSRIGIHASIGVAEHQQGENCEALFRRADRFLYRQKHGDIAAPALDPG